MWWPGHISVETDSDLLLIGLELSTLVRNLTPDPYNEKHFNFDMPYH